MGWLSDLFVDPYPSFEELRASNRAAGRQLSKDEARRRLAEHPVLSPPAASAILARIDGPPDPGARRACDALVHEAVVATGFLVRPGTVEDLWHLEGLLDRLLER